MACIIPKPVARSPLHRRLASMGATFRETSGWLAADRLGDPCAEAEGVRFAAGVCDLSFAGKWELHGAGLTTALAVFLAAPAPESGHVACCEGGYVARPTREQAFFIGSANLPSPGKFRGESSHCVHWIDRISGFGRLLLCGPQAPSVLRKLTPLDVRDRVFPNLRCAWTPMAAVRVLLARKNLSALPAFEILVSREYAEYLWDALMAAGKALPLRTFGLEALGILEDS